MLHIIYRETKNLMKAIKQPPFIFLAVVGNGIMLCAVTLFYWFEAGLNPRIHSYLDCLWWGVATITSVGMGDTYPITFAGRCVGIVLMYTGTILFVSYAGLLATFWIQGPMKREIQPIEREVRIEEGELSDIRQQLDSIEQHLKEKP